VVHSQQFDVLRVFHKERVFKEHVIKTTITKGFLFRINTNGASPEF